MFFTKAIMLRNNCKRFLFFAGFMLCTLMQLHAQRPVVSVEVDTSGEISNYGPNRRFFIHGVLQLGMYNRPYDSGLKTNWWSSGAFTYGIRSKFKLWSWESITLDLNYRYDRFGINQKQTKAPPLNPLAYQRERISVHNLSGSVCNRINFSRRGNVMGEWLEFGVYADRTLRTSHVTLSQYYDSNSTTGTHYKNRTKITGLAYLNDFNYGLTMRIGYDYAGVFVNYRVNDLIKDPPAGNYGDLPRLMFGIEIYTIDE